MANWCKGRLRISGQEEVVKKFMQYAKTEDAGTSKILDADKFIPMPRIEGEVFVSNEWGVKHWGTKWGICEAEVVAENGELGVVEYQFETAWSPCDPVVIAMSKQFPELLFVYSYFEPDVGFEGCLTCKAGKIITQKVYQYVKGGTEEQMANENNNKPMKKFQAGGISGAIWTNQTTLQNGSEIETLSVTVDRAYKDKDGDWKHSGSLRLNDIPKAILVLSKAFDFIASKNEENTEAPQE